MSKKHEDTTVKADPKANEPKADPTVALMAEKPLLGGPMKIAMHEEDISVNKFRFNPDGTLDTSKNVREMTADRYDLQPLIADILYRGLQTRPLVMKAKDGRYDILRGYRRISAMLFIHKQDQKKFNTIPCDVVEGIDEHEAITLMIDQGNVKQLNRVELQFAFERARAAGYTLKEIYTILRGLLHELKSPEGKAKTEIDAITDPKAKEDRTVKFYYGRLQQMQRIYESPKVLHDAAIEKLRGNPGPTDTQIAAGHKAFRDAAENDLTLNRDNPGDAFNEWWKGYNDEKTAAAAENRRPRSQTMKSNDTVKTAMNSRTDSTLGKLWLGWVLGKLSEEQFAILSKVTKSCEAKMTEDEKKLVATIAKAK